MVNVLEAHRELWNLMREYDQYLHSESGPTNKFWQQYLHMMEILFDIRKSGETVIGISILQLQSEC